MKKTKKNKRVSRSLFSFKNFILFFLFSALIGTNSIVMFLKTGNIDIPQENMKLTSLYTLGNVVFFGLVFSVFDNIRRKSTIEKPVRQLLEATEKIAKGDFSTRIQPNHKKRFRTEMDVIIEDFNEMTVKLSGMNALQNDFIANVSHELKTPLAVIQNYAMLLQDTDIDAEQRMDYAQKISRASKNLTGLITNILKLNKLENQQIYLDIKVYDLGEQLCESLLNFENLWEKKNIDINNYIDEDVKIRADEEMMMLVWNNLFNNALKFTPAFGKLSVTMKKQGDWATVAIQDTGCGMSDEVQKHIFEKFYQGDPSHSMRGNGLGLALVKRILDISGGKITVDSREGEGSTFTVYLKCE